MRRRARPVKAKAGAKRRPNAPRKGRATAGHLEQRLAESLEQQAAAAAILHVISSSPTDVRSVFDTMAASALRLCDANLCTVFRYDGKLIHLVALHQVSMEGAAAYRDAYPAPPGRGGGTHRAILTGSIVHIPDIRQDPEYELQELARANDFGCVLSVPMLRDERAIGAITVGRKAGKPFSAEQIDLLKIFAEQAVIAIENVRLFAETKNALERQMATGEILRVISSSPTSTQPVFDIIAESAVRLFGAEVSAVTRLDGDWIHVEAIHGPDPAGVEALRRAFPMRPGAAGGAARAIHEQAIVHIPDVLEDPRYRIQGAALASGFRALLGVPMLRDGHAIGAVTVGRAAPGRFSDTEVQLLGTFAEQAVIAIENVRLFTELHARNAEMTETLARQTATGEVLRAISRAQTDVQPVFDIIAASALRLGGADYSSVSLYDGKLIRLAALENVDPERAPVLRRVFPMPADDGNIVGRTIRTRGVVQIPDVREDPVYVLKDVMRVLGFRSLVSVPLLRDGEPIGAVTVGRVEPGRFPAGLIELLQTFADQAVIAIENVRLFNETKEALEQQTATGEVLRVIASSPTDIQPVFAAVAASAARLCDAVDVTIFQVDGGLLRVAVHDGPIPSHPVGQGPSLARGTPSGRAILEGRTIHVADLQTEVDEFPEGSEHGRRLGFRTVLTVPLMREGVAIGAINLRRTEARLFTERQVALLQTFAAQAVIAIENVRLFRELDARTGELTRSVGELRALGEVGQAISASLDLQTVLSAIVLRATQLSGTDAGVIYEYDDAREVFVPRATERLEAEILETLLATPIRKGEGATGRLAEAREAFQVPDILEAPADSRVRDALVRAGYRALLAVPLLREEHLLGGLTVIRRAPGTFPAEVIDLLRTFATQSALAMQNARLFHEIEDKSGQLEVASRHKSEFLANMSHELRTPLNAIIGYSEMLAEEAQDRAQEAFVPDLERINVAAKHLLDLINDVLDLSKVEAGRMELEAATFELPAAIESALALVRERAGRRGVALGSAIDARVGSIRADERKVKQVLLNLLSNALKFTPEGGRVEVRAAARDHLVEVAVSDTGVGIAPEDQEAIFEEFRQVGTADKKVEGTGLGLTLARKFIELHGGRMWVASRLGEGATFTFTLPAT